MRSVDLASSTSSSLDAEDAAKELVEGLSGGEPKLAIAFAPAERDPAAFARALRARLPGGTRLLYATSGAPIGPGGSTSEELVLAALSGDLEVGIGIGRNLSQDPVAAGGGAMEQAASQLGTRAANLDLRTTVGLVIDDGVRLKKEELLLGVLDANPALNLVGGGAGDGRMPGSEPAAFVGIDGEVEQDAVTVTLLRTHAKWATFRHHAYRPTGDKLVITKVDETYSRVLEIDGKPAAQAYADLLGVGVDELEFGNARGFSDRPTAMRVGREYFMRAPWQPLPDGTILFSNSIIENTELELMKLVDIVPALETFLQRDIQARVGEPTGALYFNCYGRFMMEQAMGLGGDINAAYAAGPRAAGMNAVFEIFNGFQINSTLTALAFGRGN